MCCHIKSDISFSAEHAAAEGAFAAARTGAYAAVRTERMGRTPSAVWEECAGRIPSVVWTGYPLRLE